MLTRDAVRDFLKDAFKDELQISPELQQKFGLPDSIKELSESQFVLLLQDTPEAVDLVNEYLAKAPVLRETDVTQKDAQTEFQNRIRALLKSSNILAKFKEQNDPTKPLLLEMADDSAGYSNLQMYVDHKVGSSKGLQKIPSLKDVWKNFIASAQKSVVLNVFDFDLKDVAQVIIDKSRDLEKLRLPGDPPRVRLGIDGGVIKARPEVKAVFDLLSAESGIQVTAVDSVGLNHQKMVSIDWEDPAHAAVLFSSGNLTQSCIGPEGDLIGKLPPSPYSIPNANHVITMNSQLLATLVNHELSKTLDLKLKGRQKDGYPLSGAYQVRGPSGASQPDGITSLTIAFSPHGAFGDINRDIIARMISTTRGPIRMAQFAFSSDTIVTALLARAESETREHNSFDFESVGDTPFALANWSGFVKMSGLKVVEDGKVKKYVDDPESPWMKFFGASGLSRLRDKIRVAPKVYGTHSVKVRDASGKSVPVEVTSKIHHKVMVSGGDVITGSYNFSEGALDNQEQILWFHDSAVAKRFEDLYQGLRNDSVDSVYSASKNRNAFADSNGDAEDKEVVKRAMAVPLPSNPQASDAAH